MAILQVSNMCIVNYIYVVAGFREDEVIVNIIMPIILISINILHNNRNYGLHLLVL